MNVFFFLGNKKYYEKYLCPHNGSQLGLKLFGPQRSSFTDLQRHEDEKMTIFTLERNTKKKKKNMFSILLVLQ